MANIDLTFLDNFGGKIKVEVENNAHYEEVYVAIRGYDEHENSNFAVWLDISTAIKFAKALRTEINKAKEMSNG